MIRENGGFEMFKMIEVEKYQCNDRQEADKRQNEVMKELKATMNKNRSFIINEEKKQYYEANKENYKDKNKQYREDNKDKIKRYREDNKEKINEYNKEYYSR